MFEHYYPFTIGILTGWTLGFACRIAYLRYENKKMREHSKEYFKEYEQRKAEHLAKRMASWPVVKSGRHVGKAFDLIGDIAKIGGYDGATTLDDLAERGNLAATNAIFKDDYENSDAPFYYGKIQEGDCFIGYIISHKDLYGE